MPSQIIYLSGGDCLHLRAVKRHADLFMLDAFSFMAVCPKCNDVRSQGGFGSRTLLRLLKHNKPIEAYCRVCDEFWPISHSERAALASALEG
jgi:hypothetical protein